MVFQHPNGPGFLEATPRCSLASGCRKTWDTSHKVPPLETRKKPLRQRTRLLGLLPLRSTRAFLPSLSPRPTPASFLLGSKGPSCAFNFFTSLHSQLAHCIYLGDFLNGLSLTIKFLALDSVLAKLKDRGVTSSVASGSIPTYRYSAGGHFCLHGQLRGECEC